MCRCNRRDVFFATPEMKCIRENDVPHEGMIRTVANVKRGIELEIRCGVAGEADGRCVFGAALPIDLHPPSLVEIIRVAQDRFVFVGGMNKTSAHLIMFSPISSFDEWLRIDIQMRRPVYEANRKEIRLFP